ncbi:VOC family protein [Sphingomonas jatrophae]|uniref:Glyoxalase superfamily enzyme, possibly 3-demethylubiquinone-9 3-methyltransferase n=1 Tax=Sphingomonas jatrophae TaxID=1166337 RepID=A0A1I6L1K8_9SPHN|nr:VOC family protein [Sphingomonas jatrophae]SFR97168.1 Glyoxalase superfamily enzyme, possibly 3-demethylubiquinone-9 3-methyltransferase [Sphingomonas jatrophae]
MSKISPCLWFVDDGEAAAKLYVSLFPDARIDRVQRAPADFPGGKAGAVQLIEFTLAGQSFQALNGFSPPEPTQALSLSVNCDDQAEVDRIWDGFLAQGGAEIACGWIKDPWGYQWQIVPQRLAELMAHPDPETARRAMEAMMGMTRIDVAALDRAVAR